VARPQSGPEVPSPFPTIPTCRAPRPRSKLT